MKKLLIFALVLMPVVAQAAPEVLPRYNAQETIRRAEVGSYDPRLKPSVRVRPEKTRAEPNSNRYERATCRPDPTRPLDGSIICETRK